MSRNGKTHTATTPYWMEAPSFPESEPLNEDIDVDVAVIGGGLTGLTAAYLLATAGKSVAVFERGLCASVDTGHTTAHLTMVTDRRLSDLAHSLGREHAQATWDAGLAALAQIDEIVRDHEIDCDFAWVDGYLHAAPGAAADEADGLRADADLAASMGFDATFVDDVPFMRVPGVRYDNQARVHIRKDLAGLVRALRMRGGRVFEHSPVQEFRPDKADPLELKIKGGRVRCGDVVIATHTPLQGLASMASAALFQTKLALYSSYVVAGVVPKGTVPDALFWDTADPYNYLRVDPLPDHDLVIYGGEDHKTGQVESTTECFERVEQRIRERLPEIELKYRWSGQLIDTPDGLPYIGRMTDHQYAATGFNGNGITFGTLGAMMMTDAILGRSNPWADLYDPGRKAVTSGLTQYLKQNVDYPYYMVRDRFAGAESRSLRSIPRGQGQVIERQGEKVAAYRDRSGALVLRSAICPHLGCVVAWNDAEVTWDCPCHGSRFSTHGEVISGPAESPLPPVGDGDQA